jgi:hypothetical protein
MMKTRPGNSTKNEGSEMLLVDTLRFGSGSDFRPVFSGRIQAAVIPQNNSLMRYGPFLTLPSLSWGYDLASYRRCLNLIISLTTAMFASSDGCNSLQQDAIEFFNRTRAGQIQSLNLLTNTSTVWSIGNDVHFPRSRFVIY